MARRLRIRTPDGESVTGRLAVAKTPSAIGVLLAHGAGAPQDHPFMVQVRDGLAAAGITTMTFNYRYTEAGRKSPDRLPKLLDVHRAAANRLTEYVDHVVLAGKSMGGRVGSHLVGDEAWPAAATVYLGYPLVPMGRGEPRPIDHLARINVPQLFVAGTRDRLSPPELITTLAAELPAADVHVVAHGDHSFNVPKRSGTTTEVVLTTIVGVVAAWVNARLAQSGAGQ